MVRYHRPNQIFSNFCAACLLSCILFFGDFGAVLQAQTPENDLWIRLEKAEKQPFPFKNIEYYPLKHPKVALVLSGGGARGLAHIGVLKAFEEHKIPVDLIVGTSIGSIIGGFYSAGFSAEDIRRNIKSIDWNSIFNDQTDRPLMFISQKSIPRRHLVQFRLDGVMPVIPTSISQGQRIFQTLYNKLLKASYQTTDFDQLKIPFRAVATDIISGQKVVLADGDLAEAINASMAFPLLFAPVEIDGMRLADGGITDNLPVQVAQDEHANIVIAVDCTSELRAPDDINAPWEVADQVTSIMMKKPTEESRQLADVLIMPELGDFKGGSFEFSDSLVELGYQAALTHISEIERKIVESDSQRINENRSIGEISEIRYEGLSKETFQLLRSLLLFHSTGEIPLATNDNQLPITTTFMPQTMSDIPVSYRDVLDNMRVIYQSGYVQDIQAHVSMKENRRILTFLVREQPEIESVVIDAHPALPDSVVSKIQNEHAGKRLNILSLVKNLERLQNAIFKEGYSLTHVSAIRFLPESNVLHISLNNGRVDDIRIHGNDITRNFVILREMPLKVGDLFENAKASRGIENIYGTGLFDRVLINLQKEDSLNIMVIKVKEKRYQVARLGAHYSTERLTEGFAELLADNFLGTQTKMSVFGAVGEFSRNLELRFYTVRLFRSYLTASASTYYSERQDRFYRNFNRFPDYEIIRRGFRFSVGQQIQRLGIISVELRAEEIDLGAPEDDFSKNNFRLRSISVNSVVDKRDKLPFPESGIYNRWSWEAGSQRLLGGSEPFTRVFLGLEGYYNLQKQLNYHPYVYAGSADLTLPFTEYFFFGGQNSFPGLHEREIFGRQFIQAGLDMRYKLEWNLPVEAFLISNYSVGAAWEEPDEDISTNDFVQSVSASVAINSLLGPIQLTYAYVFKRDGKLQFSMGFDF